MTGRTPEEIAIARAKLAALDPALARADKLTPPFEWRVKTCGFPGLASLIIEQQVSTASAAAIWAKLEVGLGGAVGQDSVMRFDEVGLKAFGISGQKARYLRNIAVAERDDQLNFNRLISLDDEGAIAELTAITGIGRWTAEAYLMGCEGRTDIFPAGDLALQEGLRWADGVDARPTQKDLYARAERWRPYRGVAAHLLWGYYAAVKKGAAAPYQTDAATA